MEKETVKSVLIIFLSAVIVGMCIALINIRSNSKEYKTLYQNEQARFDNAQKKIDSLETEKIELGKQAVKYLVMADSTMTVAETTGKQQQQTKERYGKIIGSIDGYTVEQLDSFLTNYQAGQKR